MAWDWHDLIRGGRTPKNRVLAGGSEHHEQVFVVRWAKTLESRFPELKALYAVPNGGYKTGHRLATKMNAEGRRAGVPDLCLPVARNGYIGLYIEMKWAGNTPTKEQKEWLQLLQGLGHLCVICYTGEAAQSVISVYLGIEKEEWDEG